MMIGPAPMIMIFLMSVRFCIGILWRRQRKTTTTAQVDSDATGAPSPYPLPQGREVKKKQQQKKKKQFFGGPGTGGFTPGYDPPRPVGADGKNNRNKNSNTTRKTALFCRVAASSHPTCALPSF